MILLSHLALPVRTGYPQDALLTTDSDGKLLRKLGDIRRVEVSLAYVLNSVHANAVEKVHYDRRFDRKVDVLGNIISRLRGDLVVSDGEEAWTLARAGWEQIDATTAFLKSDWLTPARRS